MAKRILTIALALFVAAAVVALVVQGVGGPGPAAGGADAAGTAASAGAATPGSSPAAESPAAPRKVVAYYVHGQKRCNTCRAMESQSREALEAAFPDALLSGRLEWREVNTDDPGNGHYATDWGLVGSSLVLADLRDGRQARFKVLQKAWDLAADPPAFKSYVVDEARPWLEGD